MARIERISELEMERTSVHGPVEATYSVLYDEEGQKLVQIDTYGSTERVFAGKKSQSIQIDRDMAARLRQILDSEFGGEPAERADR